MRTPSSTSISYGGYGLAIGIWLRAGAALAQACCAGGAAYQPARLKLHEDWLFGISAQASGELGHSDPHGAYSDRARGEGEQDFTENLLGTLRVFDRGQLGLSVPFVESNRYAGAASQFGGSLGDISLTARWDFLYSNESAHFPGVSLLAGITFPTGIPAESSALPLGANTTGLGAWQVAGGLSLERTFIDRIVVNATALVTQGFERRVGAISEQLGTQFSGLFAAGWIFPNEAALAVTFTYSDSLDARLNRVAQPDSEIQVNTLGLAGGIPLTDEWRLQGTVFWDLPFLGRNHIDSIGASLTVIRSFL